MTEAEQRAVIVAEAMSWRGTPYVPGGAVKGAGTDCGMIMCRIFQATGHLDPAFDPRPYPIQWHFHQAAEKYLGFVERFAHPLPDGREPGPGDVVLFRFGKCFSHGAIVIDWPVVLHAMRPHRVGTINVKTTPKLDILPRRFFTIWP